MVIPCIVFLELAPSPAPSTTAYLFSRLHVSLTAENAARFLDALAPYREVAEPIVEGGAIVGVRVRDDIPRARGLALTDAVRPFVVRAEPAAEPPPPAEADEIPEDGGDDEDIVIDLARHGLYIPASTAEARTIQTLDEQEIGYRRDAEDNITALSCSRDHDLGEVLALLRIDAEAIHAKNRGRKRELLAALERDVLAGRKPAGSAHGQ